MSIIEQFYCKTSWAWNDLQFQNVFSRTRIASNILKTERTGSITPFSPLYYTKQLVALRLRDYESQRPTNKWDVILNDTLQHDPLSVIHYRASFEEAKSIIAEFNKEALAQKKAKRAEPQYVPPRRDI